MAIGDSIQLQVTDERYPHLCLNSEWTCETRHGCPDKEWDTFVASITGGHYSQSSVWAAAKASLGWSSVRLVVNRNKHIIAGAQVLVREFLGSLRIAHVLQGPVLASNDSALFKFTLDHLIGLMHTRHIQYLALRPPCTCTFVEMLRQWGFQHGTILSSRRATLVVDLSQDYLYLLHNMRRATRSDIRLAEYRGVVIREGKESDIPMFHELMKSTGRRKHFSIPPASYFYDLWRSLYSSRNVKLFIAEYQGEPLAGLLTILFGTTVVAKMHGWIGSKKWLNPNELLFWSAMKWSKENGFASFDLDGIDETGARALLGGKSLPSSVVRSGNRFKIGFGGSPVLFQPTFEYVPSRALALALRASKVFGTTIVNKLSNRLIPWR